MRLKGEYFPHNRKKHQVNRAGLLRDSVLNHAALSRKTGNGRSGYYN